MPAIHHVSPRIERKALLVGIGYDAYEGGSEWNPIPTSADNVQRIATFLESEHSPLLS